MAQARAGGRVAAVLFAGLSGTASVQAATPSYVGKWALEPAQCRVAQSARNAPLILKARSYDQYEAHCQLGGIKPSEAGVWRVDATCTIEGSRQKQSFTFAVAGDELTVTDNAGKRIFKRCR